MRGNRLCALLIGGTPPLRHLLARVSSRSPLRESGRVWGGVALDLTKLMEGGKRPGTIEEVMLPQV